MREEAAYRPRPGKGAGWLIAGVSLAILFGVVVLKAQADPDGENELDRS